MAVYRPCYATRSYILTATDISPSVDNIRQIDSALEAGSEDVDKLCHRRFYNVIETQYWNWPSFQRAYPWRIWFDERELADVTVNPPVVTTGSGGGHYEGTVIPDSAIFWGHPNYSPPYTYLELDRSQSYAFGTGPTPQRDVGITGTFGYWIRTRPAGSLAAIVSSATATTITVSDSSQTGAGVGDVLTVDAESMLVQDNAMAATGQQQTGSGCTTALSSDNVLEVGTGSDIHPGEILQLDAEWLLAESVTGNYVTVQRAVNGTALAEHSGAGVYALRLLTVGRGTGGTTAATHGNAAPVAADLHPGLVRELAIAETLNYTAQKTSAYARTLAAQSSAVPGAGLPALRDQVWTAYARKARRRVV